MKNHWITLKKKKDRQSKYKIRLLYFDGTGNGKIVYECQFVEDFVFTAPTEMVINSIAVIDENGIYIWHDSNMGTFSFSTGDEMTLNFSSMRL